MTDTTSRQAATARRMIGGVYGHRRWHEERETCKQKGCNPMTTTPDSALDDAVEQAAIAWEDATHLVNDRGYAPSHEMQAWRTFVDALKAYGEARYEAGRRDAEYETPCWRIGWSPQGETDPWGTVSAIGQLRAVLGRLDAYLDFDTPLDGPLHLFNTKGMDAAFKEAQSILKDAPQS